MLFKKISNWIVKKANRFILIGDQVSENTVHHHSPSELPNNNDMLVKLNETHFLVKARDGWFLANCFDHYIGLALIYYGEYSWFELAFLQSITPVGGTIIEVGANNGSMTVGLARHVGPLGKVLAFEPQKTVFNELCANLALNKITNIDVLQCGCGAQRSKMHLFSEYQSVSRTHNSGAASLNNHGKGDEVSVFTLDELVRDFKNVNLIKVDVEGMELEVLKGATQTIQQHRPFLYVENAIVEKSKELIEWVMNMGYRLWWHTPPLFNPDNFFANDTNLYGITVSVNMICAPHDMLVPGFDSLEKITDAHDHILNRMNALSATQREAFLKDLFKKYRIG